MTESSNYKTDPNYSPRIDAGPLSGILLDDIASLLSELLDIQKLQIPKGEIYTRTVIVGPSNNPNQPLIKIEVGPYAKLFAATLTNDGPDDAVFTINRPFSNLVTLKVSEQVRLQYAVPLIQEFYFGLATLAGVSASIRISGEY